MNNSRERPDLGVMIPQWAVNEIVLALHRMAQSEFVDIRAMQAAEDSFNETMHKVFKAGELRGYARNGERLELHRPPRAVVFFDGEHLQMGLVDAILLFHKDIVRDHGVKTSQTTFVRSTGTKKGGMVH